MQRIQVGVFDDDEIFRRGVVACLGDDDLLVVAATGGGGAVPSSDAVALDVAVVAPEVLDRWHLPCRVVVCSGSSSATGSVRRGAAAVMAVLSRKTVAPEQLVNAVRAAAVGLRIADSDVTAREFDDRSLQVLRLLADGADTREISASLGWSERTIKGVIAEIQQHLGARSRTQAVAVALRRELI